MARLYDSGMTLQQVGDEYGVSRERVRQMLAYIGHKRRYYTIQPNPVLEYPCKSRFCTNKVLRRERGKSPMFCSELCRHDDKRNPSPYSRSDPRFLEWMYAHKNKYSHKYYWGNVRNRPDFKEKTRERNIKYGKHKSHRIDVSFD